MTKKEKIIYLYYEKKLKEKVISKKIKVSTSYVTKIIKSDTKYKKEKQRRKQENKLKQKKRNIECIKRKRLKQKRDGLDEFMKRQHIQASYELSGRKKINNRAFRNWNSSIYRFHSKTSEYRVKEELLNKISYAVPKKIKWK